MTTRSRSDAANMTEKKNKKNKRTYRSADRIPYLDMAESIHRRLVKLILPEDCAPIGTTHSITLNYITPPDKAAASNPNPPPLSPPGDRLRSSSQDTKAPNSEHQGILGHLEFTSPTWLLLSFSTSRQAPRIATVRGAWLQAPPWLQCLPFLRRMKHLMPPRAELLQLLP